jgi:hypothetical protein
MMATDGTRDDDERERNFDDAWAHIVANYGAAPSMEAPRFDASSLNVPMEPVSDDPVPPPVPQLAVDDDEHHYVPPPPPPLPRPHGPAAAAWAGLIGGPLLLMFAALASIDLPGLLTAAAVIGFVGGLVYLIATMDGSDSREGWDNGAQV